MVTMMAGRPVVLMTEDRISPADVRIRTDAGRTRPVPVRLTRRGRIVVTVVSALLICAVSMALATAAQATRAGGGGTSSLGRYVAKVVVRPGQSLWTVAEAYDPDADTRLVIAEIEQMNSLTGDQLQPGEELWVPRG